MREMPGFVELLEFVGGVLWASIAGQSVRYSLTCEMVFQFVNHRGRMHIREVIEFNFLS